MEDRLKELMQDLGNAINESVSDSDLIAAAIGEIKRAGYDVFLVLEATIGFNERRGAHEGAHEEELEEEAAEQADESRADTPTAPSQEPTRGPFDSQHRIKWTSQDDKFLKALKISPSDDPPPGTDR